jgi:hypothetical protein
MLNHPTWLSAVLRPFGMQIWVLLLMRSSLCSALLTAFLYRHARWGPGVPRELLHLASSRHSAAKAHSGYAVVADCRFEPAFPGVVPLQALLDVWEARYQTDSDYWVSAVPGAPYTRD